MGGDNKEKRMADNMRKSIKPEIWFFAVTKCYKKLTNKK